MSKPQRDTAHKTTLDLTRGIYRRVYSGARTGRRINKVSIGAEFLFWRLHMIADDFGNFMADPSMIRSEAMPRRDVPLAEIEAWIKELADIKLIKIYTVDGEQYGHVIDFMLLQPCAKNGRRVRRMPKAPDENDTGKAGEDSELPASNGTLGIRVHPGESTVVRVTHDDSGGIQDLGSRNLGNPGESGRNDRNPLPLSIKSKSSITPREEEEEKQQPEKTECNRTEKGAAAAGDARRGDRENKSDAVATPLDQAFARVGINRKTWPKLAALPGITPKLVDRCHTAWRGRRGKGIGALVGDIEAACAQAAAKPAASAPKYHVAETRTEPPLSPEVKRQIAEQARRDAEQERRHNRAPPHPVAAPSSSSLQLVSA